MSDELLTKVWVCVPKGFDRDRLDYNALDSHSREIAKQTWIRVNGKILPCVSFRVRENGNLTLEVCDGFFDITDSYDANQYEQSAT